MLIWKSFQMSPWDVYHLGSRGMQFWKAAWNSPSTHEVLEGREADLREAGGAPGPASPSLMPEGGIGGTESHSMQVGGRGGPGLPDWDVLSTSPWITGHLRLGMYVHLMSIIFNVWQSGWTQSKIQQKYSVNSLSMNKAFCKQDLCNSSIISKLIAFQMH